MQKHVYSTAIVLSVLMTAAVNAEDRAIKVEFDAPATNYGVTIEKIHHVGKELWVVSRVIKRGDFGGAAITRVTDEIKVDVPDDLTVVHHVLGKTWGWGKDTKSLKYVKSEKDLAKLLKVEKGKLVWQRKKEKDAKSDS